MQSPEIPKPKPERSLAQMEALNRARVKAQEVRRQNADLKLKEKAIAKAEKDQKASEINRRYQALDPGVAAQAPQEPAADPPEATQPTEEEEEVVYEKAPKPKAPKKRRVVVVQESDSEEEEIEVVLPKKKNKPPPIAPGEAYGSAREPPPRRPPNPFMDRPFFHSPFPY